jgi:hypothetical protein
MRYWLFGLLAALAALTYLALLVPAFFDPTLGGYSVLVVAVWVAAMIGLAHSPVPKD